MRVFGIHSCRKTKTHRIRLLLPYNQEYCMLIVHGKSFFLLKRHRLKHFLSFILTHSQTLHWERVIYWLKYFISHTEVKIPSYSILNLIYSNQLMLKTHFLGILHPFLKTPSSDYLHKTSDAPYKSSNRPPNSFTSAKNQTMP